MDTLHIPVKVTGIRADEPRFLGEPTTTVEITAERQDSVDIVFHTPLVGCPHIGDTLNITIDTTDH